ncbi:type VI secretion system-associated protein TagF [Paraburkholderia sp. BR10954]|uniref:type VI secretion system-associated protein TagF n=1 Tax=Paraburkholderia sp. BR10954 TaxID=3236995 RepID=UPI0034D329CF
MTGGIGFFGKLPGAGDFVQRRLPPAFVQSWDRHFQRAIETGRREFGAHWHAAWRQGAAWRFVLPAAVCGNLTWCGLVGPAHDRLGRAFPMVLAAPCGGDIATLLCNHAWFDALERVYRGAQDEALSVETFDARVAALPGPQMRAQPATDMAALWRALPWNGGQWQLALPEGSAVAMMLAEAWSQLGRRPGPWCLWWTEGSARLVATRGLPPSYAALLEPPARQDTCNSLAVAGLAFAGADSAEQSTDVPMTDTACSACTAHALHIDDRTLPEAVPAAHRAANLDAPLLLLDEGRTLVLSADDGPSHPQQSAARAIRETAQRCAADLPSLRSGLLSLHAQLRAARHDVHDVHDARDAAPENGAALVARFDAAQVRLLRFGAVSAWHYRRGQLQPLFVERAAGAGGEFDDLLFGNGWLTMPGIGAAEEPDCDEACVTLEDGDRLLLLVTRALTGLSRACLSDALASPTNEDVRLHLAACAGLAGRPAQWPLAVIGVGA